MCSTGTYFCYVMYSSFSSCLLLCHNEITEISKATDSVTARTQFRMIYETIRTFICKGVTFKLDHAIDHILPGI